MDCHDDNDDLLRENICSHEHAVPQSSLAKQQNTQLAVHVAPARECATNSATKLFAHVRKVKLYICMLSLVDNADAAAHNKDDNIVDEVWMERERARVL